MNGQSRKINCTRHGFFFLTFKMMIRRTCYCHLTQFELKMIKGFIAAIYTTIPHYDISHIRSKYCTVEFLAALREILVDRPWNCISIHTKNFLYCAQKDNVYDLLTTSRFCVSCYMNYLNCRLDTFYTPSQAP